MLLNDRYKILHTIKAGGMGCVYRALDTRLDTIVAVKQMLPASMEPGALAYARERFREEARILSTLRHPGLPAVTDYFTGRDTSTTTDAYYLVMTFIEGKDLETIIAERKKSPFPPDEVMSYFTQVLAILDYLHTRTPPVIYRDIKPPNIMLKDGVIFLVDFGIARVFVPVKPGTAIGTAGYCPVEQYKGMAEPRSDLYSLGAVVHYLLTGLNPEDPGRAPFHFPPVKTVNRGVPEHVDRLVTAMLEMDLQKRPPSARHVLQVLRNQGTVSRTGARPLPSQDAVVAAGGEADPARARVWVNVDKPTQRLSIHSRSTCGWVIRKSETPNKGIGTLKRDGGWVPFARIEDAERYCAEQFGHYTVARCC